MANGSFSLDISAFVAKAKGNQRQVVQKVFLDVANAVVARTPVGDPDTWARPAPKGYVGGRARGSWQYGYNSPTESEPGTIDGSGGAATQRLEAGVRAHDALGVHYITSTVPYMRRLEYEAWSGQAPEGMVRVTIAEYQRYVDDAVKGLP